jgi:hypothetical protein
MILQLVAELRQTVRSKREKTLAVLASTLGFCAGALRRSDPIVVAEFRKRKKSIEAARANISAHNTSKKVATATQDANIKAKWFEHQGREPQMSITQRDKLIAKQCRCSVYRVGRARRGRRKRNSEKIAR